MLKNYEKWLVANGFATITASNKKSTVYDYLRGLKRVCSWENKTVEQVADSISDILPMYCRTGIHNVRGRMLSRSVRSSLNQFSRFLSESQVA